MPQSSMGTTMLKKKRTEFISTVIKFVSNFLSTRVRVNITGRIITIFIKVVLVWEMPVLFVYSIMIHIHCQYKLVHETELLYCTIKKSLK